MRDNLPRVRLTPDMAQALEEYQDQNRGRTTASIVREALACLFEREGIEVGEIHPPWGGAPKD